MERLNFALPNVDLREERYPRHRVSILTSLDARLTVAGLLNQRWLTTGSPAGATAAVVGITTPDDLERIREHGAFDRYRQRLEVSSVFPSALR